MTDFNVKRAGDVFGREVLPEQEYTCEIHGAYSGVPIKFLGRVHDAQCPECAREKEKRFILAEKEREEASRKAAEEKRRAEKEERLKEMNIGRKFWNESFDTFKAYTPALKHYLDICVTFADDPQGRMLLMLGKNGNGKNHLAASILQKTGGCIYSVFEIELLLKECYSGNNSESELYKRLCDIPVLVINEIGRHKAGEWEMNFMSYIINKRYENLMPIVFISNAHMQDDCPKNGCPECLQVFLGDDILSRIAENGEIMLFNEDDYRYKKREMRAQKEAGHGNNSGM